MTDQRREPDREDENANPQTPAQPTSPESQPSEGGTGSTSKPAPDTGRTDENPD